MPRKKSNSLPPEQLALAYEFGRQAFFKGIKCAPYLDTQFMTTFTQGTTVGQSVEPAKYWQKGWTEANLRAGL
ncbi:hypothetical protein D3C71_2105590 [compost metagenome]